jgi:phage baseplate assembly protein V
MINDLKRIYTKILMKIFYLMSRGELKLVDNTLGTQYLGQKCLAGEYVSDIERLEEYGITSYPIEGAETFSLFNSGNRDQGVVIKVHDSRYRPTDLAPGDVCVYTYKDATLAHRIWLKASDGSIHISGSITLTGDITASGDVSDSSGIAQTMAAMRTKFNSHTHGGAVPAPAVGEQM